MESTYKYLIDTNIILDVLFKRDKLYKDSNRVLELCNDGMIKGYVSTKSICDIFYLLYKASKDLNKTYEAMRYITKLFYILPIDANNILDASILEWNDFEDCLLYLSAFNKKCDGIITRNTKHFKQAKIRVYKPKEIVEELG